MWYIISVVSVCQMITVKSIDVGSCISSVSPGNTGQVCVSRSFGEAHRSSKVENHHTCSVKIEP